MPTDIASRRAALGLVRTSTGYARATAPAGNGSVIQDLGAVLLRIGEELLAQRAVQAAPVAALAPAAPPPAPEPQPEVVAVAAVPEGKPKSWTLEGRDIYTGAKKLIRITPQPDGASYAVDSTDRDGNPRRSILKAEFGQSKAAL